MAFNGALISGTVSRSPATIQEHRLLRDGHSTKENFEELVIKDESQILEAQKNFAFVSGGQLAWLDLLRPVAFSFNGFQKRNSVGEDSIGPVTRWYSTNTFYRKPNITSKISSNGKELSGFLPQANKKGILFLLGPYSFSRLAENSFYENPKEMAADYMKAIAFNSDSLKQKGYHAIIFSEPSFAFDSLKKSFDESLWDKSFFDSFSSTGITTGLNIPLADAAEFIPLTEKSAVDFIGVDAFYSDFSSVSTKKDVLIGLVNGSRIGIESPDEIMHLFSEFTAKAEFNDCFIGSNDRLFDVPFEQGLQKIKSLSAAAEKVKQNE